MPRNIFNDDGCRAYVYAKKSNSSAQLLRLVSVHVNDKQCEQLKVRVSSVSEPYRRIVRHVIIMIIIFGLGFIRQYAYSSGIRN